MKDISTADLLKLLGVAGDIFLNAKRGYDAARELAAKGGVTPEDLDAADARFTKVYTDPLNN